mmetsp:Transcript_13504/g.29638  ORF Transcript_13504/g.29638 Transcript_13504/m.29638 type:complete len:348 (-) Transcript_13504:265-1308(-)
MYQPRQISEKFELKLAKARADADLQKFRFRSIYSAGILLFIYTLVSFFLYKYLEDWSVGDCLYFSIVVVTTVGYGDFLPSTDGAKILTVLFIFFSLSSIAYAITVIQDELVKRAYDRLQLEAAADGLLEIASQKTRRQRRVALSVGFFSSLVLTGTVFYAYNTPWEELAEEEEVGDRWVNGLYLTVITMTSVGFGDLVPVTDQGKAFSCLLMLSGIPACLAVLRSVSEAVLGSAHDEVRLQLVHDLSPEKFQTIEIFVTAMHRRNLGHCMMSPEGKVSRFDYLCFVLVRNGVISLDNIENAMLNFDELDKSQTGFIGGEDVASQQLPFGAGSALANNEDPEGSTESI